MFTSVTLTNSDLLLFIASFLDPLYDDIHMVRRDNSGAVKTYKVNFCFPLLQTFHCLFEFVFTDKNRIQIVSIREHYISSLNLCNWSLSMGIVEDDDSLICSLVCRSKSDNVVSVSKSYYGLSTMGT